MSRQEQILFRVAAILLLVWILSRIVGCASPPEVDNCPCAKNPKIDLFTECNCFWGLDED